MATKLKGKSPLVSMLLLHGEKIVIGIVGLVALWFVYRSLKVDKLPDSFQADKLTSEITQTSTEINSFNWEKALTDHPDKVKKAQPITATGEMTVKIDDYVPHDDKGKPSLAIDKSIIPPVILR